MTTPNLPAVINRAPLATRSAQLPARRPAPRPQARPAPVVLDPPRLSARSATAICVGICALAIITALVMLAQLDTGTGC